MRARIELLMAEDDLTAQGFCDPVTTNSQLKLTLGGWNKTIFAKQLIVPTQKFIPRTFM